MLSVCVPVGPHAWYKEYLGEALESIMAQTLIPHDIVLVDDMAGLTVDNILPLVRYGDDVICDDTAKFAIRVLHEGVDFVRVWRAPWRLGIPAVANVGIALGQTELVFQFSCDDRLLPDCLEECWALWSRTKDPLGYYWVGVEYSTGETQALPCGHALVPKALWRHTGGFPPETAIGGCDATFISTLATHGSAAGKFYGVSHGRPLYWHREHDRQYTKHQMAGPDAMIEVRKNVGNLWQPVSADPWGRLDP